MRVWIDPDACVGSGQCVRSAHEVFDQRAEDGVAVLVQAEPPASLHDAVRAAVALCPSAAIRLDEAPMTRPMTRPMTPSMSRSASSPVAVVLPGDQPRRSPQPFRRAVERLVLPAGTSAALERLGREGGVSAHIAGLAAFAAVIHRHTGQRDLLLGASLALDGAERRFAVRIELDPDAAFRQLLREVEQAVAGAPSSPGDLPVQISYSHGAPAWRAGPAHDLALTVDDRADAMMLELEHNADLFNPATAARLLRHVAALLRAAALQPLDPVGSLPVHDAAPPAPPWALPVPPGHVSPAPPRDGETLVDRFRETARAAGDRLALRGTSVQMSYAELDRRSDERARAVASAAPDGSCVAILCGHDVNAVVAVWSVLKAGATYVPLDPRHPDARLGEILADTSASAILCDPELAGRAAALSRRAAILSVDPSDAASASGPPLPAARPEAPAYVLYTSGSTGRPKGVVQSHRNVLAHALRYADRIRIGPGDQVPLLARFTFDAAVMDLFGALLTGAGLHVLDPVAGGPEALRGALAEVGATILHATPTLLRHLLADARARGSIAAQLASVRVVVLGGEEVNRADLDEVRRHFRADTRLVNGLGPTECTVALQYLPDRSEIARATVPVGYPVEGVEVDLVDERGRPTEVFGELVLRSQHVALGYWRQPDATAAAFGTAADGTPFYRTGDLARRLPDGALVFCGRKDQQVKIRGHRVEPGEAESLLRAHPTVARAAVLVEQHPTQGPRLVAYVTSSTPFMRADPDELAAHLARQLPDYALPGRVVVLDEFPVGPTGKLDRSRLPAEEERAAADAPSTPLELALAAMWCDVLTCKTVGVRQSFLGSGGDSLKIMQILDRLRRELDADLPLPDFLDAPTIEGVAAWIEQNRGGAPARAAEERR